VERVSPGLRDREPIEELAVGQAEQVRDGAGVPEREERRVDAVLKPRSTARPLTATRSAPARADMPVRVV